MCSALLLLAAGCTGAGQSGATPAGGPASTPSSTEPVTIRVASVYVEGHSMNKLFEDILTKFKADNPNVTITEEFMPAEQMATKLKSDAASNNLPDIFPVYEDIQNLGPIKAGLWMDLGPELTADPTWAGGFSPATLASFQYADAPGQWGVPLIKYGVGFFYNTELFAKAQIQPPTTWDELLSDIDALKAAGITPWALGGKDSWRSEHLFTNVFYKQSGIDKAKGLSDGTLTYSDPSVKDAFTKLQELNQRGAFDKNMMGTDYAGEVANFGAGKAAMQMNGTWAIGEIAGSSIVGKAGFFQFPSISDQYAGQWMGGVSDAFAVKSGIQGAEKDATLKLLKVLTSADTAKRIGEETGNLPAVTTTLDPANVDPLMVQVSDALNKAEKFSGDFGAFETGAKTAAEVPVATQAVLGGQMTPDQAVQSLLKAKELDG